MSGSETMDSLNWIPQVKTNHDSVDNTNRYNQDWQQIKHLNTYQVKKITLKDWYCILKY